MSLSLLLSLIQMGLKVVAAHTSGNTVEIAKTGPILMEMAGAIDTLYREEIGQPMDWSKIHEHDHLG